MVREIRYTRNEGGGKGPVATGGKGNKYEKELWRGKSGKKIRCVRNRGGGREGGA